MNGRDLGNTEEQRGLAYTFNTLKVSAKTDKVEKAADGILAFVTWASDYQGREIMLQLYKTLVHHRWNTAQVDLHTETKV